MAVIKGRPSSRALTVPVMAIILLSLSLAILTVPTAAAGPALDIAAPTNGLVTGTSSLSVTGTTDGTNVTVNGAKATLAAGEFSHQVQLTEGPNTILVVAEDVSGNTSTSSVSVLLDTVPPAFSVIEPVVVSTYDPVPTLEANRSIIDVSGVVEKGTSVSANGVQATISGYGYLAQVPMDANVTSIVVTATDAAGNIATITIPVIFDDQLELNATLVDEYWEKKDKRYLTYYDRTEVKGTTDPGNNVTINGVPIEIEDDGSFKIEVMLDVGRENIVIEARDGAGNNMTVQYEIERLEWTPFVVPVELAVILLIIGLLLGSFGGMVLGRHRERKAQDKKKQEALRKVGKAPPTSKEIARAQTDERRRRKELEMRKKQAPPKAG